jgi:hypothetical protein
MSKEQLRVIAAMFALLLVWRFGAFGGDGPDDTQIKRRGNKIVPLRAENVA